MLEYQTILRENGEYDSAPLIIHLQTHTNITMGHVLALEESVENKVIQQLQRSHTRWYKILNFDSSFSTKVETHLQVSGVYAPPNTYDISVGEWLETSLFGIKLSFLLTVRNQSFFCNACSELATKDAAAEPAVLSKRFMLDSVTALFSVCASTRRPACSYQKYWLKRFHRWKFWKGGWGV